MDVGIFGVDEGGNHVDANMNRVFCKCSGDCGVWLRQGETVV